MGIDEIDESIFEIEQLTTLAGDLRDDYAKVEQRLQGYLARIQSLQAAFEKIQSEGPTSSPIELARRLRDEIILASQDLVAELGDDVLLLQLIQARARTESVLLPEVDITPEIAFEIARRNRRDWANARASLVDSWRQIEVIADDLESILDLEVTGQLGSSRNEKARLPPGRPVNGKTGNLRVGLQWDAPITRVLERNAYRQQLILYEQAKRRYYNFEDSVWQLLRAEVRQLQANRLRFELGRQAVAIAAEQIELNADIRALNDARGRSSGPTAARDAIQALDDLLQAQNGLLDIFVNYEVVRRGLDLDLGTMELTPEGLWIDPGAVSPDLLLSLPGTTSGGMIECECNDCCLPYNPLPPEPQFNPPMLQTSYDDGDSVLRNEPLADEAMLEDVPVEPMPPRAIPPTPMQDEAIDPLPLPDEAPVVPDPPEPQLVPIQRSRIESL